VTTSNVSIANEALQLLGSSRKLESLTQDHPNARTMNAAFERTRQSLIRRYEWSFAKKRASIAADGDQTVWGEHNRYSIPNDYLRLTRNNETGFSVDWQIEGGFIVTDDDSPLEVIYIADIDDPNAQDSLFREAFANRLAFVTCKEITGSTDLHRVLNGDFKDVIAEAKQTNAIEKPAQGQNEEDDTWLLARH
jgi:hypothetical protein